MPTSIPHYSSCLYRWDLSVWRILHQISTQQPEQAAEAFALEPHIVSAIAELSPRECEQLSSGVICSFIPLFSHIELENIVAIGTAELVISSNSELNMVERIYWELVARAAFQNPMLAAVRFGISQETAILLGQASPIAIHDICTELHLDFRLRFEPNIILEMQHASATTALMKRAAAALA
ncbi:hypothetical protein [Halomonas sp. KO116]|uniref:hypothetical protein n=1 Tax=Halomonas sp. KO116 TaxID=1504981 RepID=UPI0004E377E3|nr:hypothetical protein [Halomonas sp. KO116]AJY53236.1 hypothetical protein KO116_P200129 [Halomonas sp. KO116]